MRSSDQRDGPSAEFTESASTEARGESCIVPNLLLMAAWKGRERRQFGLDLCICARSDASSGDLSLSISIRMGDTNESHQRSIVRDPKLWEQIKQLA